MNNNAVQRTKPIFARLDDAIREVRKATRDEADVLAAAIESGTPASFAFVHVAHLDLIDTVHRLVLLMDVARRSTNQRLPETAASMHLKGVDTPAPVCDPFAVVCR